MRFGVMFANTGWSAGPEGAARMGRTAEDAGFDSLWTVEHVVVPSGYESAYPYDSSGKMARGAEDFDLPDPFVWLTFVAATTSTIKLGTGILILPQRNPLIVAKEVATLDHLSGGRALLGVGVGWLAEEFAALGVPFEDRGRRLDEYVDALRCLWTADKATMQGRYVDFRDCISRPRPANGTVPIVVGGHTERAARRAGRLGDGFFPGSGEVEDVAVLLEVMRREAEAADRDPDAIEVSVGGGGFGDAAYARIERLAELGVARVMCPPLPPEPLAALGEALTARFG